MDKIEKVMGVISIFLLLVIAVLLIPTKNYMRTEDIKNYDLTWEETEMVIRVHEEIKPEFLEGLGEIYYSNQTIRIGDEVLGLEITPRRPRAWGIYIEEDKDILITVRDDDLGSMPEAQYRINLCHELWHHQLDSRFSGEHDHEIMKSIDLLNSCYK